MFRRLAALATRTAAVRRFASKMERDMPTNAGQATGLERFQLDAEAEGKDVFDMAIITDHVMGTIEKPILIESALESRLIGCTSGKGDAADGSDMRWMMIHRGETKSCPHCGSVFQYKEIDPTPFEQFH